jgi:hypothetical protein
MMKVTDLQSKYNVTIRGFSKDRSADKCTNLKTDSMMDDVTKTYVQAWRIHPGIHVHFVITDTKRGALERAKYHWRNRKMDSYSESVLVIEPYDKNKAMNVRRFLRDLHGPLNTINASQLLEKERDDTGNWGKASILRLEDRERSRHTRTMVWANAGTASDYDSTKTYYYLELKGWDAIGVPISDIKSFYVYLHRSGIFTDNIYGVRKSDIEAIKTQKNWVELSGHVRELLKKTDTGNVMSLVKQAVDINSLFKHNVVSSVNQNSPYAKLYNEFKDVGDFDATKKNNLEILFKAYGIVTNTNVDPNALIAKYKVEVGNVQKRYPLLNNLSYYVDKKDVAEYINAIDQVKGI